MKNLLTLTLLSSLSLLLIGCGNKDTMNTKSDNTNEFAVASCNKYLSTMNCFNATLPDDIKAEAKSMVDKVITQWKTLPEDQLTKACDANVKALEGVKDQIKAKGCSL